MHPRTAALEKQHALRHRTRAAPDAHPAAATTSSELLEKRRTNFNPSHTQRSHWPEGRWLALGSVCSVFRRPLQGASEQPTPGRDRIRLRSQQAKPLPVDLNPYLRRWANLITCACATFYQAAPPACGFVFQLQVPGPSTL